MIFKVISEHPDIIRNKIITRPWISETRRSCGGLYVGKVRIEEIDEFRDILRRVAVDRETWG